MVEKPEKQGGLKHINCDSTREPGRKHGKSISGVFGNIAIYSEIKSTHVKNMKKPHLKKFVIFSFSGRGVSKCPY